jgi:tetratricopeptide (TPR) repeat protein
MLAALDEVPRDHSLREAYLRHFGSATAAIVEIFGDLSVLDRAVAVVEAEIRNRPPGDPIQTVGLYGLVLLARLRSGQGRDTRSVQTLIAACLRARASLPPDHPSLPEITDELRRSFRQLHEQTGEVEALSEAIRWTRNALHEATDPNESWYIRSDLGDVLRVLYERHPDPKLIDEAMQHLRKCLNEVPTARGDHPDEQSVVLGRLGNAWRARYQQGGDVSDLVRAVEALRASLAATPAGCDNTVTVAGNLVGTLRMLYDETNDESHVYEALRVGRVVADSAQRWSPAELRSVNNVAVTLLDLWRRSGDSQAADIARSLLERVVTDTADDDPDLPGRLSNLGQAVFETRRFDHDRGAVERSVQFHRQALAVLPARHPNRPGYLSELGSRLVTLHQLVGDVSLLEEAHERLAEAVSLAPATMPGRNTFVVNYVVVLVARFDTVGEIQAITDAVRVARNALDGLPAEHPDRVQLLRALARALKSRRSRLADVAAGREARALLAEAARTVHDGPLTRAVTANMAGLLAMDDGDWREATEHFAYAIALLPGLASRRLSRRDRESQLALLTGLIQRAAACAAATGAAKSAVTLLERGRGILLRQALENHSDLTDLRRWRPDLADRFEDLRQRIDLASIATGLADQGVSFDHLLARHDLAQQWQRLIDEIRSVPNFEQFPRYTSR